MDSEREKVIGGLEYIENAAYGWNINGMTLGKPTEEIENICAAAITLLKAQGLHIGLSDGYKPIVSSGETKFYQCGVCLQAIDIGDNYCRNCGRKVKWND